MLLGANPEVCFANIPFLYDDGWLVERCSRLEEAALTHHVALVLPESLDKQSPNEFLLEVDLRFEAEKKNKVEFNSYVALPSVRESNI